MARTGKNVVLVVGAWTIWLTIEVAADRRVAPDSNATSFMQTAIRGKESETLLQQNHFISGAKERLGQASNGDYHVVEVGAAGAGQV